MNLVNRFQEKTMLFGIKKGMKGIVNSIIKALESKIAEADRFIDPKYKDEWEEWKRIYIDKEAPKEFNRIFVEPLERK